jgi:hypothetical protein
MPKPLKKLQQDKRTIMFNNLTEFYVAAIDADLIVEKPLPTLTQTKPVSLITIGPLDDPLVTIDFDGTVTIHRHGADVDAANLFWGALEIRGKSLIKRVAELEEDLAKRHRFMDLGQPLTDEERVAAKKSGIITKELL